MIVMEQKLLTVKEVAERIRVTPYTVRKYLRNRVIPATRLEDGTWLVKASDVDAYLEKRMQSNPEETN